MTTEVDKKNEKGVSLYNEKAMLLQLRDYLTDVNRVTEDSISLSLCIDDKHIFHLAKICNYIIAQIDIRYDIVDKVLKEE